AAPPTSGPGEGDQTTATTTEQWWAFDADGDESLSKPEFEKATPTLVSRFDEIDVDRDKKLSRDEIRTWHESQKARMDADQGAGTRSTAAEPAAPTAPATAPSTAPATGEEPATSPPDTAGQ
ncbi:MAG: hypothetical protein K0R70_996, partial [Steroidobacteraceae bacterium]|nr:hypothetical protein [Steroidobacteraceae bacterium]